jgi:hypothetical protein
MIAESQRLRLAIATVQVHPTRTFGIAIHFCNGVLLMTE